MPKCIRCNMIFEELPEFKLCFHCFVKQQQSPNIQIGDIVEVLTDGRQSPSCHYWNKGELAFYIGGHSRNFRRVNQTGANADTQHIELNEVRKYMYREED